MVNGATTAQNITQYRLRPVCAGDLAIGPISVEVGGQVFATEPIAVTVTQGTGQAQRHQLRISRASAAFPIFLARVSIPQRCWTN